MIHHPPRERPWVSWLWVVLGALVIYATVPFARQVREWVSGHNQGAVFTYLVVAAVGLGLLWAGAYLWRQRQHGSTAQFAWLAAVGGICVWRTWQLSANPEEAVHFIEYGILGLLAFRALGHTVRDPSIYLSAVLVVALAGTLDEVIQWLTPGRHWDFRDVGFNTLGGALMVVGLAKGLRPAWVASPLRPASVRLAGLLATAQLVFLSLCVANTPSRIQWYASRVPGLDYLIRTDSFMTEFGHRIVHPTIGTFYSRFTTNEVRQLDALRSAEVAALIDRYPNRDQYSEFTRLYNPATDPFAFELRTRLNVRDRFRAAAQNPKAKPELVARQLTIVVRENDLVAFCFPNTLAASRFRLDPVELEGMRSRISQEPYHSAIGSKLITRLTEGQLQAVLWTLIAGVWYARARLCRRLSGGTADHADGRG